MAGTNGVMQRWLGKVRARILMVTASATFIMAGGTPVLSPDVWGFAGVPVNGAGGTYAGYAAKGDILVDITNATFYQNTNTLASPTWTQITTATGAGTYTGTFDGIIGGNTPAAASFTNATATGYYLASVGNALTAVGTNRGTALQLAKEINNITTAAASTGVLLPVGVVGMRITVFNGGANPIQVYGTASETIDGVAGATGVPLTNAKRAIFEFVAANTWVSAQLGVASA